MPKSSYQKHLIVLEAIALRGVVSSYELSKIMRISVSHAQWWLKNYQPIREVKREKVRRQRVLYGLTMIGFLMALKRPKVQRNFADVYAKFLNYPSDDKVDPKEKELKENLLESLKSDQVVERFKEFYLSISYALDDLTDIYSMDDATILDLATRLAFMKDPGTMESILHDLYPKVLLFQRLVDAYRQHAINLDKIVRGEMR
jgi:hypothetical protein